MMLMSEFIDQIEYAQNKVLEEQIFQRWIIGYQFECTYEDFKNRLMPSNQTTKKSKEEILDDVRSIITLCEGGGSIV